MIRRTADTLGRMLLSLILAVLVWAIAIQEGDPTRTDTYPQDIPITLLHQPPDTIIYDQSAAAASVVLRAPTSVWNTLTPEQISVTLDLAGQPFGVLNIPLDAAVANEIVQVVSVKPDAVRLVMEPTKLSQIPVNLAIAGEPALGYTIRAWETTPSTVAVFGPASRVDEVVEVRSSLNIQDKRQSVEQTVRLSARDANGAAVEGVTLSPEVVQAKVTIEQRFGFRDLAVRVVITGEQASGYRISNIKVTPAIVAAFGSSEAISDSPGYVETVPVNVQDAQGPVSERVALNLPGGISMLGEPYVQVEISIEAIQSGLTLKLRPLVQGLATNLVARVSPEYVDLVLTGPLPRLQTLRADEDVRVIIDVANLEQGTHQITPRIIVPEGIVAESILPPIIQATLGMSGTVSPLPTPTLGPTPTPKRKP